MTNLWYGKIRGHSPGTAWETGFYFQSDTLSDTGAFNTFDAFAANLFITGTIHAFGYQKYQTNSQGADWVDLYSVNPLTDRKTRLREAVFSSTGTSAIASLPPQNAPVIFLYASATTHRSTGRIYLPPFSGNALSAGSLSSTAQQEIADFLKDGFAQFTVNLAVPVIRNRKAHTSTPVVRFGVSGTVATHRSRITPVRPTLIQVTL